jgi:transcriptional regulator with XRE-family HTH domain
MVAMGNRMRELREAAGMSRQQIADAAGVSVRAVIQWELGEREPGWFNVVSMAEALGVDCRAFLEEPVERPESRRGRPTKAKEEPEPPPKRHRGRPRKSQ